MSQIFRNILKNNPSPRSLTPGAARPPTVFPPYQRLEKTDLQYVHDMRNFKTEIFNISRILGKTKTSISNTSRIGINNPNP